MALGVCKRCAQLPELFLARPIHCRPGLEYQIKRCAANPNGYEILNYRWQNDFNPLQCSVQSLFNVFHLPSNHKAIKTLHTSFCLQTQYAEPKEKLTSVQQMLELTFSSREPSLPPLWNISFTGKCNSMIKVIMCLYLTVSVCFVYWIMSVWSALCGVVFVLILGLIVSTSSCDEIQ